MVLGLLKVCGMFYSACLHSSRAATKPTHAWKTSRHICAHTRVRNLTCVNMRVVTRPSPMLLTEPNIKTAPTPTRYKAIWGSLHPLGLPLYHPISPVPCIPRSFSLCPNSLLACSNKVCTPCSPPASLALPPGSLYPCPTSGEHRPCILPQSSLGPPSRFSCST